MYTIISVKMNNSKEINIKTCVCQDFSDITKIQDFDHDNILGKYSGL